MTAVTLQHPLETPASDLVLDEPPSLDLSEVLNSDDHQSRKKHKKSKKEEKRKRSLSCSTDASCCSTSSKKKKKKKKHHRRSLDEPPSPKVNPIFLWVKEDNAKIVEVRCEDYDRRNRIKLTKTAGGWRAIPHVDIKWKTPGPPKVPGPGASSPPTLEPASHDLPETSCDELVNHKIESVKSPDIQSVKSPDIQSVKSPDIQSVKSPDIPVRGETPPPKLEICKAESYEPMSEVDSREMPPLEPQTNVSPRKSIIEPETSTVAEVEADVEMKDDHLSPALPEDHQSEPIHYVDSSDGEHSITETVSVKEKLVEDHQSEPIHYVDSSDGEHSITETVSVEEKLVEDHQSEPIHYVDSSDGEHSITETVNVEEKLVEDTCEEEKQECAVKCCDEAQSNNVDENHNNEFDSDQSSSCMIEPSHFFQDVEEILGAIENSEQREGSTEPHPASQSCVKDVDEYDHSALMSELEEMMNERMKHENSAHKDVLDDIYTFVPSPTHASHEKPKPKEARPTSKIERVIEAVKAKTACAMMAKVNNASEERPKDALPPSQLKTCELESLDLLWRLPEGTTIHHSKLNDEKEPEQAPVQLQGIQQSTTATISLVKPSTPIVTTPATVPNLIPSQPVQEEPLNLGKPRRPTPPALTLPQLLKKEVPPTCKLETKPSIPVPQLMEPDFSHAKVPKMTERFTPDTSKSSVCAEPLAQLKEIMSDPDVTVPDPLLVPKERLSALIANPKREIPRLMALTNEVKYPKLDTNLMEVSLAHLQLLLQSSKKDDELKLIQKHADLLQSHLKNDASALDPATMNALNQMFWLPYISHLDMSRGSNPQELMGMMNMMYPYNAWGQQSYDYAQQSHLMNFWQERAQKPNLASSTGVSKGYGDMYKPLAPVIPQSLYTSAPTVRSQLHHTPSYHSRPAKHSRRHHRSGSSLPQSAPDFLKSAPDFLKTPFDVSWAMPQTSESGRTPGPRAPSRHESRPESSCLPPCSTSQTPVSSSEPSPKLKVRKFDVDPNAVPKLINKNLTVSPLPPLSAMAHQVPSHYYDSNHLWNPLYGAYVPIFPHHPSEAREPDYTSTGHWNWTTPVTVSGK